jgi:hypothetical protein
MAREAPAQQNLRGIGDAERAMVGMHDKIGAMPFRKKSKRS